MSFSGKTPLSLTFEGERREKEREREQSFSFGPIFESLSPFSSHFLFPSANLGKQDQFFKKVTLIVPPSTPNLRSSTHSAQKSIATLEPASSSRADFREIVLFCAAAFRICYTTMLCYTVI